MDGSPGFVYLTIVSYFLRSSEPELEWRDLRLDDFDSPIPALSPRREVPLCTKWLPEALRDAACERFTARLLRLTLAVAAELLTALGTNPTWRAAFSIQR